MGNQWPIKRVIVLGWLCRLHSGKVHRERALVKIPRSGQDRWLVPPLSGGEVTFTEQAIDLGLYDTVEEHLLFNPLL